MLMTDRLSLKDKAYAIIRGKIISCEYRPGEFLNERELRNIIGASRTPIREAFNKLEQEGFLVILPKRGVMVQNITLAEVNAIYEIRCMIEPFVVEKYGHLISPSDIQIILNRIAACSLDVNTFNEYDVDSDMHGMLLCASRNPYIIDLMKKIFGQNHRLRILSGQYLQYRLEETAQEHEMILRYLLEKKYNKAAEAMRIHLENSRKASIELLSGNIG